MNTPDPWQQLHHISAVVLAAGRAERMGGCDKGLMPLGDSTMVAVVCERVRGQVAHIAINAARNHGDYAAWAHEVFADDAAYGAYAGPLAGVATALARTSAPWLVTLACDTPLVPRDLVARLAARAAQSRALIVTAAGPEFSLSTMTAGPVRPQPTVALLHTSLCADLDAFVRGAGRKIDAWTARHAHALATFDAADDAPWAWANANTPEELAALQALWTAQATSA